MAILLEVEKESPEKFPLSIEFQARLVTAEIISTALVTSKNRVTLADTTGTIISGSASISTSGTVVTAKVHQGTSGDAHLVTFKATTSLGNIYEDEILLTIKDTI